MHARADNSLGDDGADCISELMHGCWALAMLKLGGACPGAVCAFVLFVFVCVSACVRVCMCASAEAR